MTNKYHARKCHMDGFAFDSEAERDRYAVLKMMERDGEIHGLLVHPTFDLIAKTPDGSKSVGKYTPDFEYTDGNRRVVEDVKGPQKGAARSDYRMRVRIMCANHPDIEFQEIRKGRAPKAHVLTTIGEADRIAGQKAKR
jgi:predicted NUDIX family NTP pyrophosphohydrolase